MAQFFVRCEIWGDPTGPRTSFLKADDRVVAFASWSAAQAAAEAARAAQDPDLSFNVVEDQ
jgi:hypothetical protein